MSRLILLLAMVCMAQVSFSQITASRGLTRSGNDIRLGQNNDNPNGNARLLSNRFIPTADKFIILGDVLSTRSTSLGGRFIFQTDSFSLNTSHLIPGRADFNGPEGSGVYTFNGWSNTTVFGGSTVNEISTLITESETRLNILDNFTNNPKIRLGTSLGNIVVENNNNVLAIANDAGANLNVKMDFSNNQAIFANGIVDPGFSGQFFQVFGSTFISDSVILFNMPEGSVEDSLVVWDETSKALRRIDRTRLPVNNLQRVGISNVNYTAIASDYLIAYTSLSTGRTVTLPAASSMTNKTLIIKDESGNAGANNITIDGNGSETIDGSATKAVNANYGSITIYSNGTNWFVISTTGNIIL